MDTDAQTPVQPTTTPVTPPVQESASAIDLPKPGSHHLPNHFFIGLCILFFLIIVGVVGNYFLIAKYTSESVPPAVQESTSDTTSVVVSPTPENEQEEVDGVDTTFPDSDVKAIQTDLQGL